MCRAISCRVCGKTTWAGCGQHVDQVMAGVPRTTRPAAEVAGLMEMFGERIDRETPELHEEGVRMRFIGRRDGVPDELVRRMDWAERTTAGNERITLFVAFNYGGRAEIVDAARKFTGTTEEEFRAGLYAPDMHQHCNNLSH